MGGFHGMTLGSLSATGNKMSRQGAGIPLNNVTFMPYPHGFMKSFNTIEFIENVLTDANSGIEKPAAIIFETVQAEGGVIVSSKEWLKDLRNLCDKHDILMICDDIQIGCGRTGTFFSFERAGILPDIIILSKSISGYGLPLSLLLIKPELDKWLPGEHSGTFRGNQLAFVAGKAAIDKFWKNKTIEDEILQKERYVNEFLKKKILPIDKRLTVRGIGLIWGIDVTDFKDNDLSNKIIRRCFESGLIIEKVGRDDQVIKIMPPLTIEHELLERGCEILGKVFEEYCFKK
jgi:diaminobutyrate-2-oxoglutarate transaminase